MTDNKAHQPSPGWWAVQHNIGNDRRLAGIDDPDKVLSCLGLMLGAIGWAISFETSVITTKDLNRHGIVGAASTASVLEAAALLVEAGIWTEVAGVGFDCGATPHIKAKVDRIEKARAAVEARLAKKLKARTDAAVDGWTTQDGGEE